MDNLVNTNYTWNELTSACNKCTRCALCRDRTNVVIGRGNPTADVMFVGEGPGKQEDLQGEPFVGAAGQLLNSALTALRFLPDSYYITNIVKCRPENNREPVAEEIGACIEWLRFQTRLVQPKVVVCLGNVALKTLIDKDMSISKERGNWYVKKGISFISTYHPAALLRRPELKQDFWQDLEAVKAKMETLYE